jgi:hypothetical protein
MNKELYKIVFENGKIEEVLYSDENITLKVGGEEIKIATYHESECCEQAWGDFSIFKYFKDEIVGKTFSSLVFKGVEGMGFLICFYGGYNNTKKIFIPCYSSNNGYYSDNLSLEITQGNSKTTVDIRELHEDTED